MAGDQAGGKPGREAVRHAGMQSVRHPAGRAGERGRYIGCCAGSYRRRREGRQADRDAGASRTPSSYLKVTVL